MQYYFFVTRITPIQTKVTPIQTKMTPTWFTDLVGFKTTLYLFHDECWLWCWYEALLFGACESLGVLTVSDKIIKLNLSPHA